ncbi:alpha-ketoglutarate-dependent dioxygenase AlkB [Jatrophihabitans sp. DSM 45814]
MAAFQYSLLDPDVAPAPSRLDRIRRAALSNGAWIDICPGWLSGADELFDDLLDSVPWRAEEREMYERVVAVPRLLSFYGEGDELPHPALEQAKQSLSEHYRDELGEAFVTTGLCLYRDGRDSVAFHGDRIGRGNSEDTMVAIVSLGTPRCLMLRPRRALEPTDEVSPMEPPAAEIHGRAAAANQSLRNNLGHGDLIVMGGSCQRTWEHGIPKTARPVGPRISVQFRPRGVS